MLRNEKGVGLVEVMVALLVLLIVFVGLLQAALLSIDNNTRNVLRDEAINIAAARMEELRNSTFTSLASDTGSISGADCPSAFTTGFLQQRAVRNIPSKDFCERLTCTEFGGDNNCATDDSDTKQLRIDVGWRWKGENYTHSLTTVRRR